MTKSRFIKTALAGGVSAIVLGSVAQAQPFNIPAGDLATALNAYATQSGIPMIAPHNMIGSSTTKGVRGNLTADAALSRILDGTGFASRRTSEGAIAIFHPEPLARSVHAEGVAAVTRLAEASSTASVETVVVTSSKIKGDIQTVPIAITALSQEQLTSRQIAGGPDLVKEVPNLTFSKTNFTGYNIEIRGIGTQAISVTTDPAVAVAFNDIPFIRNHFFEQEFYDVSQVEVLRGPQGTLYGRNATAGVVNVISAKPTDQFEAMLSADWGNYHNRRYEGMVNIPIVDDWLELRVAGEWTKRDGYSFNEITNQPIDGRDLWSGRVTLAWRPVESVNATLVWEHFQESDDRLRSGKQLCKTALPPTSINGTPVPSGSFQDYGGAFNLGNYFSQSCQATSLYSPDAFEVPYGFSLPYDIALGLAGLGNPFLDPYASTTQSRNLRVIESALNPQYRSKNDTLELNVDYTVTPSLTFTSQTGYNQDFLWSAEDFNRFNTSPGIFLNQGGTAVPNGVGFAPGAFTLDPNGMAFCGPNGCGPYANPPSGAPGAPCTPSLNDWGTCESAMIYCDPQLGCSDRIVAEDLSEEHAWQLSQEFRLASNFSGPFNFSVGGNYLHYETEENYYVFINALSIYTGTWGDIYSSYLPSNPPGSNSNCLFTKLANVGYQTWNDPVGGGGATAQDCMYVDTNPISHLNNKGHNYFLSQNPYELNSYAGFGEAYYNITPELKFTGGLRWTEDKKRFIDIPSEVLTRGYGYPITGTVDQQWDQLTGRAALNWMPKLDFTDQTLVYGSYAHGYKAGGANPPGAVFGQQGGETITIADHPKIFKPEFIDAYELGSKNTLLDGALTLNGDVFFYNYKEYQISEIVDRTSINLNFNATVKGAELETSWEPAPGLKFSFAGGYEDTRIGNGQSAIDLMDRTAGRSDWMIMKPFPTEASNCIFPTYVIQALIQEGHSTGNTPDSSDFACNQAYDDHVDPVTLEPYRANPTGLGGIGFPPCANSGCFNVPFTIPAGYPGFDPTQPAINNGEGFAKPLGGNQLPNAPHFTTSLTAEYTIPVSEYWAATLHSDFYWQSQSFARVFNDRPYDKIRGYSNVNLALILTSADGWQVLGYLKNVFNTTAITGAFLNSDDTGLTTNVFLTDPRLYGVRVTKNF